MTPATTTTFAPTGELLENIRGIVRARAVHLGSDLNEDNIQGDWLQTLGQLVDLCTLAENLGIPGSALHYPYDGRGLNEQEIALVRAAAA